MRSGRRWRVGSALLAAASLWATTACAADPAPDDRVTTTAAPGATEPPSASTSTAGPTERTGTTEPTETGPAPGRPAFASSVEPVTAERLGPTWQPDCPVGLDGLRLLTVSYVTFEGTAASGELVVAAEVVDDVTAAFSELYEARFPIRRMVTIDAYGGDDDASMADDNTSAFNCRAVTGGSGWSQHAYGLAIDINPLENPYVRGGVVLPPEGRDYLDRDDVRTGMIIEGDVVVRAFTARGFEWGGRWTTLKDYQHVALPR